MFELWKAGVKVCLDLQRWAIELICPQDVYENFLRSQAKPTLPEKPEVKEDLGEVLDLPPKVQAKLQAGGRRFKQHI